MKLKLSVANFNPFGVRTAEFENRNVYHVILDSLTRKLLEQVYFLAEEIRTTARNYRE